MEYELHFFCGYLFPNVFLFASWGHGGQISRTAAQFPACFNPFFLTVHTHHVVGISFLS